MRMMRGARMAVVATALGCVTAGAPLRAQQSDPELERAREILARTPVFDGHNDLAWEIRRHEPWPGDVEAYDLTRRTPGHTDLARLRRGGVGAQFWSVYIPGEAADSGYARLQLEQIDIARRMIDRYPELAPARTADEVERIMEEGRIASLLGVEGGHAIENSLGVLRAYRELGAAYMTLTHNVTLDWADAASDTARSGGLSEFGREVVREMNRLGMLVDLSHVSDATMSDALDVSEAPVIFSHSSARALTDHVRNVPDSILRRLPDNGGIVMVTFVPSFVADGVEAWWQRYEAERERLVAAGLEGDELAAARRAWREANPPPNASVSDVADHLEHVRRVTGIDHVGIGSDYDGISWGPEGLEDVSRFPALFAELLRRGWTGEELGKLASGNVLRVMREAETVARRLRSARLPSVRTPADPPERRLRQALRQSAWGGGVGAALREWRARSAELGDPAAGADALAAVADLLLAEGDLSGAAELLEAAVGAAPGRTELAERLERLRGRLDTRP